MGVFFPDFCIFFSEKSRQSCSSYLRGFFFFTQKKNLKSKSTHVEEYAWGIIFIFFLVLYFSTYVLSICVGTYATLKGGNLNCRLFSHLHSHGIFVYSAFEISAVIFLYTMERNLFSLS